MKIAGGAIQNMQQTNSILKCAENKSSQYLSNE